MLNLNLFSLPLEFEQMALLDFKIGSRMVCLLENIF